MAYRDWDMAVFYREDADSFEGPAVVIEVGAFELELHPDEARSLGVELRRLANAAEALRQE